MKAHFADNAKVSEGCLRQVADGGPSHYSQSSLRRCGRNRS